MSENMTDVFGYGRSPISRSQRMAWIRQLRHQRRSSAHLVDHVSWTSSFHEHLPFRDIFLLLLEASPKTFRSADSTSSILNCELQALSFVQDFLLNPTCGLLWAHVQNPHVDDILWKVQSHRRDQPLLIVRI